MVRYTVKTDIIRYYLFLKPMTLRVCKQLFLCEYVGVHKEDYSCYREVGIFIYLFIHLFIYFCCLPQSSRGLVLVDQ